MKEIGTFILIIILSVVFFVIIEEVITKSDFFEAFISGFKIQNEKTEELDENNSLEDIPENTR